MGNVIGVIVKVLQVPAIASLVEKLTGKLLPGNDSGVKPKVTAALGPAAVVTAILFVVQFVDPGLYAILDANRATLLELAVVVGLIFAYYTPDEAA